MGMYLANAVGASAFVPNRFRAKLLRIFGVKIGKGVHIHSGVRFRDGSVSIGNGVFINRGCGFDPGSAEIRVGDNVALGEGVLLLGASHHVGPSSNRAKGTKSAPISIGSGSWVGARTVVLGGVSIASGCIIGAGSVVTKSTEPDGVYAGVPARLLRRLSPDGETVIEASV
jgi:maltose O-acetyltransferase